MQNLAFKLKTFNLPVLKQHCEKVIAPSRKMEVSAGHTDKKTTEGYAHDIERLDDPAELHIKW